MGLKLDNIQIGQNPNATQNFVLKQNADGTFTLARGNVGATTQDVLTVDSNGKVTLTQGVAVAGIPNLTTASPQITPLPGTGVVMSYTHGLSSVPAGAELEVVCLTAELGYSIGDVITGIATASGSGVIVPFPIRKNATVVSSVVGANSGWLIPHATTGVHSGMTLANWAYRFRIRTS